MSANPQARPVVPPPHDGKCSHLPLPSQIRRLACLPTCVVYCNRASCLRLVVLHLLHTLSAHLYLLQRPAPQRLNDPNNASPPGTCYRNRYTLHRVPMRHPACLCLTHGIFFFIIIRTKSTICQHPTALVFPRVMVMLRHSPTTARMATTI